MKTLDIEYCAYILLCADGTYYTGYARNPVMRTAAHNNKKGAKYTRARVPVQLVYWEKFATKSEAMRREAAIKRLTRAQKDLLIKSLEAVP